MLCRTLIRYQKPEHIPDHAKASCKKGLIRRSKTVIRNAVDSERLTTNNNLNENHLMWCGHWLTPLLPVLSLWMSEFSKTDAKVWIFDSNWAALIYRKLTSYWMISLGNLVTQLIFHSWAVPEQTQYHTTEEYWTRIFSTFLCLENFMDWGMNTFLICWLSIYIKVVYISRDWEMSAPISN